MKLSEKDKLKYSEFISGLELKRIFLLSLNAECNDKVFSEDLGPWRVNVKHEAVQEKLDRSEYRIVQRWIINVSKDSEKEILVSFDFKYAVIISSEVSVTKRLFQIYAENNLNLNTWPYARELVNTMTARMGIPPLTLPYFKAFTKK